MTNEKIIEELQEIKETLAMMSAHMDLLCMQIRKNSTGESLVKQLETPDTKLLADLVKDYFS